MLGPDRACDSWAAWVLLLHQEGIEYSSATLFCYLHDLGGWQCSLVAKNIFDILGTRRHLHSIKKRYVDIKLLNYLDKLDELLVIRRPLSPL